MLGLGFTEILFLAVLALVVIGPKQLPEVARTLGRFLNELKRASNEITQDFKQNIRLDDHQDLPPHYHNVDKIQNLTDDTSTSPAPENVEHKTTPKSGEES